MYLIPLLENKNDNECLKGAEIVCKSIELTAFVKTKQKKLKCEQTFIILDENDEILYKSVIK